MPLASDYRPLIYHRISLMKGNAMGSYKDLDIYQASRKLNWVIYQLTGTFPITERYALADQMRRAAISITSNIAEGYGQGSLRNRLRFLYMARGSLYEVEAQLLVATDLGFARTESTKDIAALLTQMAKMLSGLIHYNAEQIKSNDVMGIREPAEKYGKAGFEDSEIPDPRFPNFDD